MGEEDRPSTTKPTDKFLLEYAANLQTWVRAELVEVIRTALEQEVLAGDGTGEHLLGLASTSGIQRQAYSTDRITTIAAGLAKVTNLGVGRSSSRSARTTCWPWVPPTL